MKRLAVLACASLCALMLTSPMALATEAVLHPNQLPPALLGLWERTKPEMNENSRCVAAFDSFSDGQRMSLKCSVYMRMGAEAERRAFLYCEEDRAKKGIHAPCRLVRE